MDGHPGWEVGIGGNLFAIVTEGTDGRIGLAHGFDHPLQCIYLSWSSLDACKTHFAMLADAFSSGVSPKEMSRLMNSA